MADRANVRVLPPIIPLVAILIGGIVHVLFPIDIGVGKMTMPLGITLLLITIILVLAAVRELKRAKTALDVRKPTTSLVTTGIYGFSRNPIYLSMVLLCIGIALIANSLPLLLTSVLAVIGLQMIVIRPEETYLHAKFGNDYVSYTGSVRRWI